MNTARPFRAARRLAAFALLGGLLTGAVGGCGRSSLMGQWRGKVPFGTMTLPMTLEFKADGTDTRTITAALVGTTVIRDTYAVKDGTLQITPVGMTVNGQAFPMPRRVSAVQSVPFKVDGDTLTLSMPDQSSPTTLARVKP